MDCLMNSNPLLIPSCSDYLLPLLKNYMASYSPKSCLWLVARLFLHPLQLSRFKLSPCNLSLLCCLLHLHLLLRTNLFNLLLSSTQVGASHLKTDQGSRNYQSSSTFKVPCQICGSTSHEAIDCFDRMNPDICGRIPPAKLAAMCVHHSAKSSQPWLIDSGTTSHFTNDVANISSTPYTGEDKVYIGDGKGLSIHHTGSSSLHTSHSSFKLRNVLHVPFMKHNLLSAYQFRKDNNCSLTLDPYGSIVKDHISGKTLLQGPVKDGFYPLQGSIHSSPPSAFLSIKAPVKVWHKRLGHPSSSIFRRVLSINNLALQGKQTVDFFCSDCALAKNHKLPFGVTSSSTTQSLQLLHCDLWGPASVTSNSGFKYYLLLVDDFSKYSWFFPLKSKSDVFSTFVTFKNYVENFSGNKIKILRSDSGGEFTNNSLASFLREHGILHQFSCPHTPEQNGCAERKHRHLVETARTLLVASHVPHIFWVEAFSTALYLINRLPISGLTKSPWEPLFNHPPDYSKLKVFGCQCYPWLKPYIHSKLDAKSKSCVFLGYSLQHKGYRCLDPITSRIYISRHVVFDEHSYPFQSLQISSSSSGSSSSTSSSFLDLHFHKHFSSSPNASTSSAPRCSSAPTSITTQHSSSHQTVDTSPNCSSSVSISDSSLLPLQPSHLPISANTHPMITRSKAGIFKTRAYAATKHPLPVDLDFVPSTYLQASKHAHWRAAMQVEYNALITTGSWSLVPSHPSQNVVGCKWVFRIKKNPDGTIDRHKARLVAKGFHQQGVDFQETFSPIAKPVTIRILLTLAIQHDWFLNQVDISNAFLHGDLKEDVYMQQPPGFVDPNSPSFVCKLQKSLYGLKQAPRAWFDKLFQALRTLGFHQSQSDASLFVLNGSHLVIVLVYVDDILVIGPHSQLCQQFIQQLSTQILVLYTISWGWKYTDLTKVSSCIRPSTSLIFLRKQTWKVQNLVALLLVLRNWITVGLSYPILLSIVLSLVGYNILLGLDRILLLLSIKFVNLCMLHENNIFKQPNVSSDFSKVLFLMVYGSLRVLSHFQHTLMLIGQAVLLIGDLLVDIVFFLALISLVGVLRNKALLLVPLPKLNISL
ncbi:retrovirus-related Pol polyprotein from transposon RE1 isoform X1 [Malus domestica]|uniref:retrovirus-related Pol polyprotein from transposon RE1 isoform X1 n=1 Tax=Malus domestica TaxID=3750 RepID=UPI003975C100